MWGAVGSAKPQIIGPRAGSGELPPLLRSVFSLAFQVFGGLDKTLFAIFRTFPGKEISDYLDGQQYLSPVQV